MIRDRMPLSSRSAPKSSFQSRVRTRQDACCLTRVESVSNLLCMNSVAHLIGVWCVLFIIEKALDSEYPEVLKDKNIGLFLSLSPLDHLSSCLRLLFAFSCQICLPVHQFSLHLCLVHHQLLILSFLFQEYFIFISFISIFFKIVQSILIVHSSSLQRLYNQFW